MNIRKRPELITDFRKLGKRQMGVTPKQAKAKHDARQKIDHRPPVSLSWWLRNRGKFSTSQLPAIHTLPLPVDRPAIPSKHSRKQNWNSARPSIFKTDVESVDNGRYSSRCTYTHYTYTHSIECWGAIVGRYLVYRIDTSDGVKMGRIKAFRGWEWKIDENGICMSRGKADYHPTADDLLSGTGMPPSIMAKKARKNHQRRVEHDRTRSKLLRAASLSRVTLHDARIAGNCVAGTMRFCKDRLGVRVHSDNPYQTVSATALLQTGDPSAERAVYAAYQRETTVCI